VREVVVYMCVVVGGRERDGLDGLHGYIVICLSLIHKLNNMEKFQSMTLSINAEDQGTTDDTPSPFTVSFDKLTT
jgi:hypothetical protein